VRNEERGMRDSPRIARNEFTDFVIDYSKSIIVNVSHALKLSVHYPCPPCNLWLIKVSDFNFFVEAVSSLPEIFVGNIIIILNLFVNHSSRSNLNYPVADSLNKFMVM
jgi:hypothetical protein